MPLSSSRPARRLPLSLAASVLSLACLAGAMPAHAALDANASTTDHSTNAPTSWWVYNNVTPAQVGDYVNTNGARITEIAVNSVSNGVPRFSVRMVRNSGNYAVPGWWWYYGLTFSQVGSYLQTNGARLIDIEPYDAGGGNIRYAVAMVSNTGTAARAWSYMSGVTSAQISTALGNSGHRLVDLDSYYVNGTKLYSMIAVANTGSDAKSWQWWLNQTPAGVASKVSAFNGRVAKLDRQADGTYNVILVNNTGSNATAWWYQYGFASGTDLINYANQVAARPVSITTYINGSGQRRYDAAFIDNANASTRRMRSVFAKDFLDSNGNPTIGIFEAYLKQIDGWGSVKVNLNSTRRAETASSLKSLHLLHAMRRVAAGTDTLPSSFVYYDYRTGTLTQRKDACPDPSLETPANSRMDYNFETGLDQMMAISDNRTTRGTVLRYGGFAPFNATATAAGLTGTTLRHNIGCAYRNPATGKFDPANLRNDTTAADLARIYEGVWNSTLLTDTNNARTEFLESANPGTGAGTALQAIINDEANKLGKGAVAAQFGQLVQSWGKGGSYGTCLPNANGDCGQRVLVRSGTGLIRLPIKVSGAVQYRTYSFARLVSDVKVPCFEDTTTATIDCPVQNTYVTAYNNASNELYRDEIRSALMTW